MKIKNAPLTRGPQRHAGLWYVKRQRGGQLAVQKWPRKYGGPKTKPAKDAQKVWGEANHHSTRPFSIDGAAAVEFSEGTPFLPRDILMKAAYGTLVEANFKDGRTLRSAREVATNAQILLDQISTTPGALLVRTADEWVGLDPGEANYVLTSNGKQAVPAWLASSSGGGGGGGIMNLLTGSQNVASTSAYNLRCNVMTTVQPLKISAVTISCDLSTDITVRPFVAPLTGVDGAWVLGEPTIGVAFTLTPDMAGQSIITKMAGPVEVEPGGYFAVGFYGVGRAGTDGLPQYDGDSSPENYSLSMTAISGARAAVAEPSEGVELDTNGTSHFAAEWQHIVMEI